ncbi:helix-turn-helix domain-containing protein [Campylobacter estrildidarum]|uniref:Helix-turn-helix domain-containing protein n=1 Tax=Campylobacter estrildidarum TaxID=2510189 RepID=A0A4V6DW86_9BACT|nr:helix-turn-helix domain-containing protein [Campylobacter estrildidarum]TKX31142.1 helix-turn-helix domain-containing protein [Campylobacter estrildidarum]
MENLNNEKVLAVKKYLTIKDLEILYNIKRNTQNKYRTEKKIPYFKVGKNIFYDRQEIDKWFLSHRVN